MADPTATCASLVNPALRIAGITGRPGRTPAPDQSTEAIAVLNRMLGSWNIDPLKIFEVSQDRYALTPSQTTYFIGPTGDFVAPRPSKIVRANIVLTNSFPELHKQLGIYEVTDWASLTIPELPGAWPRRLYNDHATPDSKLYLYPVVSLPSDLELFTLLALQQFAALTDAVVLPDGYQRAITFNLALELAAYYPHDALLAPGTADIAAQSLALVESNNAPVPRMTNDASGLDSLPRSGDSQWWRSGGF